MATKDITVDGNLTNNTTLASTDRFLVVDDGTDSLQDTTVGVLTTYTHTAVNSLTEDTTPDGAADFVMTYDTSASGVKKATPHSIFKGVNGLTEDTDPDDSADYVMTYDASASSAKKVKVQNLRTRVIYKSSDETISSNAVLQNDDALLFSVQASTTYHFRLFLYVTAANATMDMKIGFTVPASTTMAWGSYAAYGSTLGSLAIPPTTNNIDAMLTESTALSFGTNGVSFVSVFEGIILVAGTSGNVQFQWSQNTSNGSNLTVKAGSFIEYKQLN